MYKKKTDNILTGLFTVIIGICFLMIIKDIVSYRLAETEYREIKKDYTYPDQETAEDDQAEEKEQSSLSSDQTYFNRLYDINSDLVAVLSIPSIDLVYPVVQGNDNEEYLRRTFEGKQNPAGCLFMDYENDSGFADDNTYIYGHNMKDGSMFGGLKKMTGKDFDGTDVKAYITTKDGTSTFRFDKAEVVDILNYHAPEDKKGALTLYTCWANDKSRRLLVTFIREAS